MRFVSLPCVAWKWQIGQSGSVRFDEVNYRYTVMVNPDCVSAVMPYDGRGEKPGTEIHLLGLNRTQLSTDLSIETVRALLEGNEDAI